VPKGSKAKPGPVTAALAPLLNDAFLEMLISQKRFGQMVGIPQSTISLYLRGERALDLDTFVHICRALGIDPIEAFATALRQSSD
jgi:transcriptional regulator with XRE-family HTH domain